MRGPPSNSPETSKPPLRPCNNGTTAAFGEEPQAGQLRRPAALVVQSYVAALGAGALGALFEGAAWARFQAEYPSNTPK